MPRLILVRHGQSEWNTQQRVQGGGRLTSLGRAQIAALAERLRPEPITALYSSPTLRTRQTARVLAAAHDGLRVRQRKDLLDLDYGDYAGALVAEARQKDAELFRRWREAPETVHFPGGESLADLRRRVERFLAEMSARHPDETVLVVTHDSPIRALVCLALGLDDSRHRQFVAQVGSMTVIDVSASAVRLLVFSSSFYLEAPRAGGP